MKKFFWIVVLVFFSGVKAYTEIIEFKKCWIKNYEQMTIEEFYESSFNDLTDYNKILEIKFDKDGVIKCNF